MNNLLNQAEAAMLNACAAFCDDGHPCTAATRHHLSAGGSRLRARICLDAACRLAIDENDAVQMASICELLHNASLLQDDLLDRAPMRRGQASVWALFGDGVAVCTGDLMLATAYAVTQRLSRSVPATGIFELVHSRTRQVILGQVAELSSTTCATITPAQYEVLAQGKSAPLLSLTLELPLLLSGKLPAMAPSLEAANLFAVAYQIADDLEDHAQDSLGHSLNFVDVLCASSDASVFEAKHLSSARAVELLEGAMSIARDLPSDCAALLIAHAKTLRERMAHYKPEQGEYPAVEVPSLEETSLTGKLL
jgi:geranylgeranyl diphosphate synthase type II